MRDGNGREHGADGRFVRQGLDADDLTDCFTMLTVEELKCELSKPGHDGPVWDARRTELCRRIIMEQGGAPHAVDGGLLGRITVTGGATYDPVTGRMPTAGFCFSPYPERSLKTAVPASLGEFNRIYRDYVSRNKDLLSKPDHYLGFWVDRDSPSCDLYMDVSILGDDASQVRDACLEHDQIAFYDLQTGTDVTVDRNARSGQERKNHE